MRAAARSGRRNRRPRPPGYLTSRNFLTMGPSIGPPLPPLSSLPLRACPRRPQARRRQESDHRQRDQGARGTILVTASIQQPVRLWDPTLIDQTVNRRGRILAPRPSATRRRRGATPLDRYCCRVRPRRTSLTYTSEKSPAPKSGAVVSATGQIPDGTGLFFPVLSILRGE